MSSPATPAAQDGTTTKTSQIQTACSKGIGTPSGADLRDQITNVDKDSESKIRASEPKEDKLRRSSLRTPQQNKSKKKRDRERHYSAPDLSFGRNLDFSLLRVSDSSSDKNSSNEALDKFNIETPVRPVVRRASLTVNPFLEHIKETEESIAEEKED